MMETLVMRLGVLSLSTSVVLAPLLLLARGMQSRYKARACYILWLLLAIRLLLPVEIPPPSLSGPVVSIEVPQVIYQMPAQENAVPGEPMSTAQGTHLTQGGLGSAPSGVAVTLGEVLAGLWLGGCLLFFLWNGVNYLLARRSLLNGAREEPGDQVLLAKLWRGEHGCPKLLRGEGTDVPMSMSLIHPVVLLPEGVERGVETEMVLRHELGHILRRDLWYKFLLLLVNGVHWFNPLVWMMCHQAGWNLEYCCDDWVVEGQDAHFRHSYGQILLRHAAGTATAPPYATRFGDGKRQMEGRLMNLFEKKKKGTLMVPLVLAGTMLAGMLVSCESAQAADASPAPLGARVEDVFLTPQGAMDEFEDSIRIRHGELTFTIPEGYTPSSDWRIQVSGRYVESGMSMSVHTVDLEEGGWKAGESYHFPIEYALSGFTEYKLYAYLPNGEGEVLERTVELLALLEIQEALPAEQEPTSWTWPLADCHQITATFGSRVHPITGKTSNHTGVDIAAPKGTSVCAAGSGTVVETGYDSEGGNYVRLLHNGGVSTYYAHLSKVEVSAEDTVEQGQVIGSAGATGKATGSHLHLEFAVDEVRSDPLNYFQNQAESFLFGVKQ